MASLCDVSDASKNLTFLSIRARNSFINGRINVLADKLSKQFWKRIHQGLPSCSGRGPRRSRRSRSRQARLFSALTSLDSCISSACIPAPLFSETLDPAVLAKPLPASLVEEGGSLLHYSHDFSPSAFFFLAPPLPSASLYSGIGLSLRGSSASVFLSRPSWTLRPLSFSFVFTRPHLACPLFSYWSWRFLLACCYSPSPLRLPSFTPCLFRPFTGIPDAPILVSVLEFTPCLQGYVSQSLPALVGVPTYTSMNVLFWHFTCIYFSWALGPSLHFYLHIYFSSPWASGLLPALVFGPFFGFGCLFVCSSGFIIFGN